MKHDGTVTAFDVHRGLGTIVDHSGHEWPFHCVSIADGTRDIAVGSKVRFAVEFRVTREEAVDIRPAGGH
jgi:cold shock CspA family protein